MEQLELDENRIIAVLDPLRKKTALYLVITIIAMLSLLIFTEEIECSMSPIIQIVSIAVAVVASLLYYKVSKRYANSYRQMISQYVLQNYFEGAFYNPLSGFTKEEFKDAHLIHWRKDFFYHSEDLISGRYADVKFKQSDIKITHRSGRDTVTDVDGRLTRFQYKKDIKGRILVVTAVHNATLESGLSKVEMEDVEFEKQFDVFATDAHSVYYLLTPHFMEYLKSLRSIDRALYISFDGQQLFVLRSGKGGIFEPPDGPINVREEIEKNRRELDEIRKLIEVLKLEGR